MTFQSPSNRNCCSFSLPSGVTVVRSCLTLPNFLPFMPVVSEMFST